MASTNALISALSELKLNGQRSTSTDDEHRAHVTTYPRRFPHHEIRYEFPALDLVRDTSEIILPEPSNIDARSQPDASKYHLNQFQSQYCFSMDPKSCENDLGVRGANDDVLVLLKILDSLAAYEGESTLSVATYVTEQRMQFRIRLAAVVEGKRNAYETELEDQQFAVLLSARRPWIELLNDVVYRSSARSYIAAEVSMMAQDVDFHLSDMRRWQHRWNSAQGGADLQLVMRGEAVVVMRSDAEGQIINLACGHSIHTTTEELQSLRDDKRARLRCTDCDDQAAWESLDDQVSQSEEESLSTQALLGILIATVRSFEMPHVVMPAMMQLAHCEETSRALDAMSAWLIAQQDLVTAVPLDLKLCLESFCLDWLRKDCSLPPTASVPTPPGWTRFLHLWLCRGINFLIRRRCSIYGSETHDGVHWHADDNLIWWTDPRRPRLAVFPDSSRDNVMSDIMMT